MPHPFIHLHTHSHFSLLQALPKIPELVDAAVADEMPALALTDSGNLYGAIDFYKTCQKAGIKPIIGVDAYVAHRTRHDREPKVDTKRHRLVLLAENNTGYRNLLSLVTRSYLEGFYYKPRVDRELLAEYADGLIAIIPSFSGEVADALRRSNIEQAREILDWYTQTYGKKNVYLELTHHPEFDNHETTMERIKTFAKEQDVPLVAAHDTYYLKPEDRLARETLVKVQTQGELSDTALDEDEDFSFITQKRANELFQNEPEALAATKEIADRCTVELELGSWVFPDLAIPDGTTYDEQLRKDVYEGLARREMVETKDIKERIEYELKIIKDKGFSPYFLVVADLLKFARDNNILTTTRGSAAGSLVSYLVGITNVDPMEYKLPFERFLNPERPKAPDIDMDFADDRRDEVLQYAREKYGDDKVAQIGTFGTMMARGSVRDTARALGYPYALGDRIAKLIPFGSQGFPMSIERALEMVPELQDLRKKDEDARRVLELAQKIEGCARHISIHAAGVVIAPSTLTDYVPLQLDPKGGKMITQYDMHAVEEAGLLKFDFLGIKNLAILADSVERVKANHRVDIDIEHVPIDDARTFEMLARGETHGLFQLGGGGMTRYLKELKPTTIHDINAMVALYRPGPMESIPSYIERKHNPQLVTFLDKRMRDILDQSFGVLTYQDDVLLIAVNLAGYSWKDADALRKAMGKKIPAEMEAQREKFTSGAIENGMSKEKAEKLWRLIEPFAAYGFNKCLPASARVLDAKSGIPTPISTLLDKKHGTRVCALGTKQEITTARASKPFENGVKPVYTLTTRSGRTIRATGNHPLYTFTGWRELAKLRTGERVAVPRRLPEPPAPQPLAPHEAAALGYLIAEGNLCHPHGIYFYSTQEDELSDFVRIAERFANTSTTLDRSKAAASVYVGAKKRGTPNGLFAWIGQLGLHGKKATEKFVPTCVFSADNATVARFLGKLWQGDGAVSVANTQTFYATSSRRLADDVQHLLLRFGILSTIHTKSFRYRGKKRPGWTVVISGEENVSAFAASIGTHLLPAKRAALRALCAQCRQRTNNRGRGTADTVPAPILSMIKSEMAAAHATAPALAQTTGLSERIFGADARRRGFTRGTIETIAGALASEELTAHAHSDIFWDEVTSIRYDGREMTYDLSVPGPENFITDNFFVHNSHAASYGKVAYQTAYMKANYPVEYMAAVLSADSGDTEKIAEHIGECARMEIPVLPPDVNESFGNFTVVKDDGKSAIRFGLFSIKNFGEGIAQAIIDERERSGAYGSLADFFQRLAGTALNRKAIEALIKSGAMDSLEKRGTALANLERLLQYAKEHAATGANQDSLFAASDEGAEITLEDAPEVSARERLAWEKELLGVYVSGHPLDAHKEKLARQKFTIKQVEEEVREGMTTVVCGLVEDVREILTKKGDRMAFLRLADFSGSIEAVAFPQVLADYKDKLTADKCIAVKGRFSKRNDEPSIIIEAAKDL